MVHACEDSQLFLINKHIKIILQTKQYNEKVHGLRLHNKYKEQQIRRIDLRYEFNFTTNHIKSIHNFLISCTNFLYFVCLFLFHKKAFLYWEIRQHSHKTEHN